MLEANAKLDEMNEKTSKSLAPYVNAAYYVKHIILEKEDYDYIISLNFTTDMSKAKEENKWIK